MPFIPISRWAATGILVCDECGSLLRPDGSKKSVDQLGDSDFADHRRDDLVGVAQGSGWREEGERWSCADCAKAK